jgi:hypothetical protein
MLDIFELFTPADRVRVPPYLTFRWKYDIRLPSWWLLDQYSQSLSASQNLTLNAGVLLHVALMSGITWISESTCHGIQPVCWLPAEWILVAHRTKVRNVLRHWKWILCLGPILLPVASMFKNFWGNQKVNVVLENFLLLHIASMPEKFLDFESEICTWQPLFVAHRTNVPECLRDWESRFHIE